TVFLLILIEFVRWPGRRGMLAAVLMLLGFALVVAPALITTPPARVMELAAHNSRRQDAAVDPVGVAAVSLAESAIVFWANPSWRHHYVGGPLVDPVTGVLLLVGIGVGLRRLSKPAQRFMIIW